MLYVLIKRRPRGGNSFFTTSFDELQVKNPKVIWTQLGVVNSVSIQLIQLKMARVNGQLAKLSYFQIELGGVSMASQLRVRMRGTL